MEGRTDESNKGEYESLLLELQDHFGLKEQLLKDLRDYQVLSGKRLLQHVDAMMSRQEQVVKRLMTMQKHEDVPARAVVFGDTPETNPVSVEPLAAMPCTVRDGELAASTPNAACSTSAATTTSAACGVAANGIKRASDTTSAVDSVQNLDDVTLSNTSSRWRLSRRVQDSIMSSWSKRSRERKAEGALPEQLMVTGCLLPKQLKSKLAKVQEKPNPVGGTLEFNNVIGATGEAVLAPGGTTTSLTSPKVQPVSKYEVPTAYFGNNCFEHAEEELIFRNLENKSTSAMAHVASGSTPRRRNTTLEAMWQGSRNLTFSVYTSQGICQRIVDSTVFDAICAALMVSNAVFIGVEVEHIASNMSRERPVALEFIDAMYVVAFALELIIRVMAEGVRVYFTSTDIWNWLDFIIVSISAAELVFSTLVGGQDSLLSNMRVVRAMRVLRMVRVIRIVRVLRFFRSLRMLIKAIFGTMKSGVWTAGLLCMIVYMFAVVFCQGASEKLIAEVSSQRMTEKEREALYHYFGTLPRSLFTLWKSIIGGIDWEVPAQSLSDVSAVHVTLLVIFVAFIHLAVLNVVTGLFLHSAVEQANCDQEDVIQDIKNNKARYMENLQQAFQYMDRSKDGEITLDEFELGLSDSVLKEFFASLDIQVTDAWTLFKLLDIDQQGGVDPTEFYEGCLKLRGNARSLDLAEMMYETRWLRDQIERMQDFLAERFIQMGNRIDASEQRILFEHSEHRAERISLGYLEATILEEPEQDEAAILAEPGQAEVALHEESPPLQAPLSPEAQRTPQAPLSEPAPLAQHEEPPPPKTPPTLEAPLSEPTVVARREE